MFKTINLKNELQKSSTATSEHENVILAVQNIFNSEVAIENEILNRIQQGSKPGFEQLVTDFSEEIYTEEAIFDVCSKYRLRFLNSELFKGEIPYSAVQKIKTIEAKYNLKLAGFKIIAPAERFQLADSMKDPILVAKLSNGNYLFIEQWGNDLSWYNKLVNYPYRNIATLATTSIIIGFLLAYLVPGEAINSRIAYTIPVMLMTKSFVWFVSSAFVFVTALIVGIIGVKDFSENVWNSKYFN